MSNKILQQTEQKKWTVPRGAVEIFINRMEVESITQVVQESVRMLEMLPESEQELASQLIKRLVLAWDPDFTKLTPEERKRLEAAEERIDSGEYVKDRDIEW